MDQTVLAFPPSTCCFGGFRHSGTPRGRLERIGGIDTYISVPLKDSDGEDMDGDVDGDRGGGGNGKVLLYFSDAFGLYENAFLMMDGFAAKGWVVLGVDYFKGDGIAKHTTSPLDDPSFDFETWTQKHLHTSEMIAEQWIKEVKAAYAEPGTMFACVGYCWGARFVCHQLSNQGICKVGAIAHPSFLNQSHVDGVQAPLYIVAPSEDDLFPPQQQTCTREILTNGKKQFSMQVYSGVGHGFATRANLEDAHAKWAKEQCFNGFVTWFDHWLFKG